MSLRKIFGKAQVLTTILLLACILAGEVVMHITHLPTWPLFTCMVAFFLVGEKTTEIPHIIVGAMTGEFLFWVMAKLFLPLAAGALGAFPAQMVFVLTFVGCIVLFGSVVPWFLNSFTFLFFLVCALGTPFEPFLWMAISGVGGLIIIGACLGVGKIVAAICAPKEAEKA